MIGLFVVLNLVLTFRLVVFFQDDQLSRNEAIGGYRIVWPMLVTIPAIQKNYRISTAWRLAPLLVALLGLGCGQQWSRIGAPVQFHREPVLVYDVVAQMGARWPVGIELDIELAKEGIARLQLVQDGEPTVDLFERSLGTGRHHLLAPMTLESDNQDLRYRAVTVFMEKAYAVSRFLRRPLPRNLTRFTEGVPGIPWAALRTGCGTSGRG